MADGVDIDLYANIEDDFNQDTEFTNHGDDLFDDVITAGSSSETADRSASDSKTNHPQLLASTTYTGKKYMCYIGNLTWWTTDQDLNDVLQTIGIHDLIEVKFYENRANGQSKGFALIVVGSESSSRMIFEKLPKKEMHGQVPQVTPYSRQALSQFEAAARKGGDGPPQNGGNRNQRDREREPNPRNRPPPNQPNKPGNMGNFPNRGMRPMQNPQGPPPPGPPGPHGGPPPGMFGGPPRLGPPPSIPPPGTFHPGGGPPLRIPQGPPPPGMVELSPRMGGGPPMHMRGPPMPDPRGPPPQIRPDWDRPPGPFPGIGPMPPQPVPPPGLRPPGPGFPGGPPNAMPPVSGPPPMHLTAPAPHVNPAFFPPPNSQAPPQGPPPGGDHYGRPPSQGNYPNESFSGRPSSDRHEPPPPALSDTEFEEIFQRNKTVSSSAINRAVQDASSGDFASAIETLVTAISLIKQSKIAADDRCKILISSLQDTLHGIEEKSYGSKSVSTSRRSRSRDRDRERDREKRSRHRSRSREREYRERSRERERYHEETRHRERDRERDRDRGDREYTRRH